MIKHISSLPEKERIYAYSILANILKNRYKITDEDMAKFQKEAYEVAQEIVEGFNFVNGSYYSAAGLKNNHV